ncbi:hypothetical protein AAFF_G00229120 [Aldrovandia affinis]|uniref:Ferric-chelate reductase 1 n=1 Tax=Aldrovandia affinis TaxID=143900 RepID=A0AAD7WU26_9TELE|nr:hypothetical protein AAFF_G00229120 [Aldrovandia affinis]
MHMRLQSVLLVATAVFWTTIEGYRNGQVSVACESMVPRHNVLASEHTSPYTITADKSKFSPEDQITVNITASAPAATFFQGFLIEARDARNLDSAAVGSFTLVNSAISQLLTCGTIKGSAVSHTNDAELPEIQVIWNAPKDSPPSIQFLATVVQHFNTFWVKIPGPVALQNGVTPVPTQPTTSSTRPETTTPPILPNSVSSEGCGSSKSCLWDPAGCNPATDYNCFFLSFAAEGQGQGQGVVFELSGPAEGYVSFALSLDKWMGNDDVYLCVREGERVLIDAAYVAGRTRPEVSETKLSDKAWRLADGVIQCRFRREVHIPQDPRRFNLDQSYYLFLAHGRAEFGLMGRHDRQPLISTNMKVIAGTPENMSGSRSLLLLKFHGAFMLIAWMTAASTGIIIARYFKPSWPDRTIFGQKVWFQVHRALMTLAVLLTSIGFILPFIYRGKWSNRAGVHPYLGCTVMALAVIQPIMAMFRPHPDSPRRYIFNWMHRGAGTSAVIIAVAAMFLGVGQQTLLLPKVLSTVGLVGFVVWGTVAWLVLELHKRGLFKIGKHSPGDDDVILSGSSPSNCQGPMFKYMVLAVFITGNVVFLIVLLHSINSV